MKNINWKQVGLGVVLLGIATYTIVYFRKQAQLLKKSCFTFAGGVIHKLGLNDALITIMLRVKNLSDIDVKILNQNYDVLINDIYVTNIKNSQEVLLRAGTASILELNIQFSPMQLVKMGLKNIETLLFNKEKMLITIKSNLSVGSSFIFMNNIEFVTKQSLAEYLAPSDESFVCNGEKHDIEKMAIKNKEISLKK
jgi:LEA14-like dessication related protein